MASSTENRFSKQVDTIWDTWLNNMKAAQHVQEDMQQKALQVFTYQKELLDYSVKTFTTLEEESKKMSKELQWKVEESLKETSNSSTEPFTKWISSVQDITDQIQTIAWKPAYTIFDIVAQSHGQLEESVKKAFESQKVEQAEGIKKIEEFVEQVKTSQKEILSSAKSI
jgi:hypothetical protein